MINWKDIKSAPILPIFLSFLIGIISFLDTTFRLVSFYVLNVSYPSSIYLKPFFFIGQIVLFLFFFKAVRLTHFSESLDSKTRKLLDFHLLIIISTVLLYSSSSLGNLFGFVLPGQYIDFAWLLLYWIGLSFTSFWITKQTVSRRWIWISIVFLLLGTAFMIKPFENLYLWTQTHFNLALPYDVIAIGTIGPLFLIAVAAVICAVTMFGKFRVRNTYLQIFRTPFTYLAVAAILIPVFLENVKNGLPNTIIRTLGYWGLGYVGFGWYAVSLYFLSFVCYIFIIKQLSTKLESSVSTNLLAFGVLSLAWNGISILLFGYSSIPGNILSLDAIMLGLKIKPKMEGNRVS